MMHLHAVCGCVTAIMRKLLSTVRSTHISRTHRANDGVIVHGRYMFAYEHMVLIQSTPAGGDGGGMARRTQKPPHPLVAV